MSNTPATTSQPDLAFELEMQPSSIAPARKTAASKSALTRATSRAKRAVFRYSYVRGEDWQQQLDASSKGAKVLVEDVVVAARRAKSIKILNASAGASELLVRMMSMLEGKLLPKLLEMPTQAFEESVTSLLRNIAPPMSAPEIRMAQRVALVRAAILEDFGFYTREQLAGQSKAQNPGGLVDTWRSRGRIFAVSLPQSSARDADVYLAFQFQDGKPLPIVGTVIDIFGRSMRGWDLAHWFTSGNAMLPDSARPVDLLAADPKAVEAAARFDAMPSAA